MPGCSPRKSLPMVVLNGCFRLYGKIKPATVWFHYQYKNQKMLIMLENVRHDLTDYERISPSCLTLCEPMDIAHQSPLSMGFSKQEYWSGLPLLSSGDLTDPGIKPRCLHCRKILYRLSYEGSLPLEYNLPIKQCRLLAEGSFKTNQSPFNLKQGTPFFLPSRFDS